MTQYDGVSLTFVISDLENKISVFHFLAKKKDKGTTVKSIIKTDAKTPPHFKHP